MNPIVRKAYQSELQYVRTNLLYFVETYVKIEDKQTDGLIVPFELWDGQRNVLNSIRTHRLNIILKARQLGITWLALAYAAWVMLRPGKTVVALSRTETEAKELVRRIVVILSHMKELIREDDWGGMTWESTALTATIVHENGLRSTFQAFPSTPGAGRSFTANLIILDEWAYQEFAEKIWTSVFPTINSPSGGQVIGLSTMKRGTLFEQIWNENKIFNKLFLGWNTDPRRTPEWYEQTKESIGDQIYAEYPATPEEASLIVGGAFFPEIRDHIHMVDYLPEGTRRNYISLDYGLDKLACYWHRIDTAGEDIVYREVAESNLIISAAAERIKEAMGREKIEAIFAPPDLWNRRQDTGRSAAEIFAEHGLPMTKTSNDRVQGWLDLKEWLAPRRTLDEQTGQEIIKPHMRFLRGATPYLWKCLLSIQKDERRKDDCADQPHELTHGPDALRAFAAGRPWGAEEQKERDPLAPPEYDEQIESFFEYSGGY